MNYLEFADYLLIAEQVLGAPAQLIAQLDRISLAESALAAPAAGFAGVEAYPEFETKAAILVWHLVMNHPLPDGNKRCAFLALVEFAARNGREWRRGAGDPDETDTMIRGIPEGTVTQLELRAWIAERVRSAAS